MLQIRVRHSEKETQEAIRSIAQATGVQPLAASILIRRGFDDAKKAKAFLDANVLYDPFLMQGMDEAVALIKTAIKEDLPITVFGDYDCDGTCAASILYLAFAEAGKPVFVHIPDRHTEGYGLNESAIRFIAQRGGLLITVDCGITNLLEVALARRLGLTVLVTDHHQPLEKLPDCVCLNPPSGKSYPFDKLCGAGIALKLVQALFSEEAMQRYIDLAAVATIADLVPLLEENRTIVNRGLKLLKARKRPGLSALMDVCGYKAEITAGQIAFGIAPRINAAGRMGDANRAFMLFTTSDAEQAKCLAKELDSENALRQQEEQQILSEAAELLFGDIAEKRTAVAAKAGWQKGVIGIVASRLAESYGRPSAVISIGDDGICTGSARGIKGVHVFLALCDCKDFLLRYGGHEQAGGFSLSKEQLPNFLNAFEAHFVKKYPPGLFCQRADCDATIEPEQITLSLAKDMEQLAPFGIGNPTPSFFLKGAVLSGLTKLGKTEEHLRVSIEKNGRRSEGLLFRAKQYNLPRVSSECDFVGTIETDSYLGVERARYLLNAVRPVMRKLYDLAGRSDGLFGYGFALCAKDAAPPISLQKADECIESSPFGLLLTVHTPFALLRACKNWSDEDDMALLDVYVQSMRNAEHGKNALIIAPEKENPAYRRRYRLDTDDEMTQYARSLQILREEMAILYRALLKNAQKPMDINERCECVAALTGMRAGSVGAAIAVFEELGFLRAEPMVLQPTNCATKRNLEDSMVYNGIKQLQRGEIHGSKGESDA